MSEAPPICSPTSKDATSLTECSTAIFSVEKDPYLSGPASVSVALQYLLLKKIHI